MKQCPCCHKYVDNYSTYCNYCGYNFNDTAGGPTPPPVNESYNTTDNAFDTCGPEGKSRGIAALLAILLGGLGVHYFYLGKVNAGIITIILTLITCGIWKIITLIQGILMLCMTNVMFREKYVTTISPFPLF